MAKSQSALDARSKSKDRMQPEGRTQAKQPKPAARAGQAKPKTGTGTKKSK
jgi:hypothetical protein